ncbi:hypothetical protein Syn7502_01182 [Synechococcus sp. PCC 7502]|uniref:hypothetical protein n=1 Tax=Synechococcus sp. PCC 7502 TaxID=1173263 RepID=UPI00029FD34E|nr:hypothetical protein [Synechococcus sp. PCC 7502]AFY73285.1 hypothetical protein Syn7502_01182 [Synechococcus sp. PCC 7502]
MAIALSLSPEEALGYLARIHSIIVITHATPPLAVINQRIYIHTLGFPDHPELMQGCFEILEEFGFTPETFPAFTIQGYATVGEVFRYEARKFSQDRHAHGHSESLTEYRSRLDLRSPVWGVRFIDTYILEEPITDILPPVGIESNRFWHFGE